MVNPKSKPAIQDFRMDLGASVNQNPFPEQLVLGAGSALLNNKDFAVTQRGQQAFRVRPAPHADEISFHRRVSGERHCPRLGESTTASITRSMRTMRGSGRGIPKGNAFNIVPEGLLLRPAIPTMRRSAPTGPTGPRRTFKISTRELPDNGRFRVTVMAAKYNDGLILDAGGNVRAAGLPDALTVRNPATPQNSNDPPKPAFTRF